MSYTISKDNIKIKDSWEVPKKKFPRILAQIQLKIEVEHLECEVFNRSYFSLEMEWATHNFLYMLHIARSHTKDVDLNYPQKWYEAIFYFVFGIIGWIFIK